MNIRCNGCFGEYDVKFQICPHCGYVAGSPAAEVYCLRPGVELMGRYIVGNVIGLGGFGIIYKAWDMKLETVIAIKEFFPTRLIKRNADGRTVSLLSGQKDKEFAHSLERFLMEARNLALFSRHPNIVNLYEYFECGGTAYIVMEYLDGVNLDQYLRHQGGKADHETAVEIALCVCSAVRDIHAQKIVHRDISPENIIVCRNGMVKVIDLGAAYFGQNDITPDDIVVKPGYAPPEQYDMVSAQGPEVDIYAIGAVIYSMLTGVRPMESTDRKEEDSLEVPSALAEDVPEYLDGIVMKSMAVDRRFRYRTVNQLIKALLSGKCPPSTDSEIKRRTVMGYLAVSLVCVAVAVFALLVLLNADRPVVYPERTITLWYISDSDISPAGMQSVLADFAQQHPEVTVEAVPVAAREYESRFARAVSEGDVPDLFDSSRLSGFEQEMSGDLFEDLSVSVEDMLGSDDLATCFPEGKQVPVGFAAPVVYINSSLADIPEHGIASVDELVQLCTDARSESVSCAVDGAALPLYHAMFGQSEWDDFCLEYATGSRGDFVNGSLAIYIADSTEYNRLLTEMPGLFKAVGFSVPDICCRYNSVWSVSGSCDSEERECALGLLSCMLEDASQDSLHILNAGRCMPVTGQAYDEFCRVYIELNSILDTEAEYTFIY